MKSIFPQTAPTLPEPPLPAALPPVSARPAPWQQDRITRLTALAPEDAHAGLLWLAMNHPDTCDAMLDKLDYDAIDDPDPSREPEPFCAECGADLGIFLKFGLDWRHYRGAALGELELFDPGHLPVLAWRTTPAVPA